MRSAADKLGTIVTALAVILFSAASAEAGIKYRELKDPGRDYTQRGFQLYAGIGGQGYEIEDHDYSYLKERDSEGLFFLGAAIGLDRDLSLYLEGAGSEHDTPIGPVDFGYVHLGLKYAFNTGYSNPWQPYGKAAFGAMFLHEKYYDYYAASHGYDDNGYVGPSLGFGVGIDRFISRRAAVFGEIGVQLGRFDHRVIDGEEYDLADEVGVSSGRLQLGIRLRL